MLETEPVLIGVLQFGLLQSKIPGLGTIQFGAH
jgi:hypothetical protein